MSGWYQLSYCLFLPDFSIHYSWNTLSYWQRHKITEENTISLNSFLRDCLSDETNFFVQLCCPLSSVVWCKIWLSGTCWIVMVIIVLCIKRHYHNKCFTDTLSCLFYKSTERKAGEGQQTYKMHMWRCEILHTAHLKAISSCRPISF